ncbi:GNAT family N-acetyltransferase [Novosphingobium sp. G106]|uniref:GNAT family N-acetyltransferase n=1 Tax=Novosphingobium sp. G106 TaxID=2849500 RepID=UPI001C2CF154|nr:GNAT family N-acetyltransferase [Novosphingobium sp. G106]
MILRDATAADIPALSALGSDSFVVKFGDMYRPEDLAAFLDETHSHDALAQELAHAERRYRLAEIDGALAGYCKLAIPSSLAEHHDAARPIEIKQLYTAPDLTGKGIGAALMDWAMAEARAYGADAIQLSVWSGNTDAQRFYARYGFAKVADIEFWVGEQCDEEFLFALNL